MGRIMPWLVSLLLIVAGIVFGFNREPSHTNRTLWGYALMGMTCLLLGTGFSFAIWRRDSEALKGGPRHPLE